MDLGITGKKAIVCAASKGLGKACAMSLAKNGVDLVINARTAGELEATAAEIRAATGRTVTAVAADIGTAAGREKLLAACPSPDILINNNGGPPLKEKRHVPEWGTGGFKSYFPWRRAHRAACRRSPTISFRPTSATAHRC